MTMATDEDYATLQSHIAENKSLKAQVAKHEENYEKLLNEIKALKKEMANGVPHKNMNASIPDSTHTEKPPVKDNINPDVLLNKINFIEKEAEKAALNLNQINHQLYDAQSWMRNFAVRLNMIDQYGRINNLILRRLRNVPVEKKGFEFTRWIVEEINRLFPFDVIGFELQESHIETSHPMYRNGEPIDGVVIVRFSSRDARNQIFYNKSHLKKIKSEVVVTEHLTSATLSLVKEAEKMVGRPNVWTSQTKVFVNINGRKRVIYRQEQLNEIANSLSLGKPSNSDYSRDYTAARSQHPPTQAPATDASLKNTNFGTFPDINQASAICDAMTKKQLKSLKDSSNSLLCDADHPND